MAVATGVNPADILERLLDLSDRLNSLLETTLAGAPPELVAGLRSSVAQVDLLIEELEDVLDVQEGDAALEETRKAGTVPLEEFETTLDS